MQVFISYLLHSLFFFTRIPVGLFMTLDEKTLVASRVMLPLVGLILGLIVAAAYVIGAALFPYALAVIFVLLVLVLLTGGFHEDAFADTVDGFGGNHSGKDIITIMKDSRVGTFASLALIFSVLISYAALLEIPRTIVPHVLLTVLTLSRFSAVPLMWKLPYVRHDSKLEKVFKTQTNSITTTGLIGSGLFAFLVSIFLLGDMGVVFFLVMCAVSYITGWYYMKRLGGATGDCFGATIKLTEIIGFVTAAYVYQL